MRPPGSEPATSSMSMPNSRANLRTEGAAAMSSRASTGLGASSGFGAGRGSMISPRGGSSFSAFSSRRGVASFCASSRFGSSARGFASSLRGLARVSAFGARPGAAAAMTSSSWASAVSLISSSCFVAGLAFFSSSGLAAGLGSLSSSLAAPAPSSKTKITWPTLIVSPSFTPISLTRPEAEAGTSTVAFSVSNSITGWPSATSSPSDTRTFTTTPDSTFSPSIGSLISVAIVQMNLPQSHRDTEMRRRREGAPLFLSVPPSLHFSFSPSLCLCASVACFLCQSRIRLLRIDLQIAHRLGYNFGFDLPLARKRDERRQGDEPVIDLKKVAQRGAAVAPAKSVGSERDQTSGEPLGDRVGQRLDIISRRDEDAVAAGNILGDVRYSCLLRRVKHVPSIDFGAVAMEFLIASHAPHVGGDAVFLRQQILRIQSFVQDRAAAEQISAQFGSPAFPRLEPVHAFENSFLDLVAFGHRRVRVVLVHQGQVVEDVLLLFVHPADAFADDDREFKSEGRVVGDEIGRRVGQQVAVSILMLQTFAGERRASGGPAKQEAVAARIAGGPDQVADALQSEHRIEDEEGDGVDAVCGVSRPGGDERRHRTGLGDPLFQNLTVLRFFVVEQRRRVHRLVQLADVRVDADLAEERLHAEGARLIRDDGDDQFAQPLVAQQLREQSHEDHRGRGFAAPRALIEFREQLLFRRLN